MSEVPASSDGRVVRWAGQRARRRAEFVEAAIATIDAEGPDVSVDQITARLGISRTKLYRHFDGAADLQAAVAHRAVEMITADLAPVWSTSGAPRSMITTAVGAYLGWICRHRSLYRYLERRSADSAGPGVIGDVKTYVGARVSAVVATYQAVFDVDDHTADCLAFGLIGMVESATSRWLDRPEALAETELADALGEWVWSVLDGTLRRAGVVLDRDEPLPAPTPVPPGT